MSKPAYAEWINTFLSGNNPYGKCKEASEATAKDFPELRIVRGHVHDLEWGRRSHVWLEDAEGNIVDPTRSQFPLPIDYEKWMPGQEVRVGKCMQCGEEIWRPVASLDVAPCPEYFCSKECGRALELAFNGELRA